MKNFLKRIYELIPLKKTLFSMFKSIYIPSSSIYQHLTFKDFFRVKISDKVSFQMLHPGTIEENEIFWKGLHNGWEKKSISLWIKLVEKKHIILDIGANTGLYALITKALNPNAAVYTFEPIPAVYNVLIKNNDINNFDLNNNQIALSDYTGEAKIYLPDDSDFAYSVTVNQNRLDEKTITKELIIKTDTLENFIRQNYIPKIDLMKIDVETHEPEVLIGMGKYLKEYKPTMLIEVLNETIADHLNSILEDMDYLYFNIDDQNSTIRQINKIEKSDYWNLLLCNKETAKELSLIK